MIDVIYYLLLLLPAFAYFMDKYSPYSAAGVISLIISIVAIISIGFRRGKRKDFFITALLFFLSYIVMKLILAVSLGSVEFGYRDLYNNQALTASLLMLLLSGKVLTSETIKVSSVLLKVVFWVSVIVILIQELVDPLFFTSADWYVNTKLTGFNRVQDRLPSIYSFVGGQSGGFALMSIYGLILSNTLKKKQTNNSLLYIAVGLLYAILQRSRWVLIFYVIVSLQFVFTMKFKVKYVLGAVCSTILIILLLSSIGVPMDEIWRERYLDESRGGINEGSFRARISSYEVFRSYLDATFWLGANAMDDQTDLLRDLGRRDNRLLIGILSPIFYHGVVSALFFYSGMFMTLLMLYRYAIKSGNYYHILFFVAVIVANLSINSLSYHEMGLAIMLINYAYESSKFTSNLETDKHRSKL